MARERRTLRASHTSRIRSSTSPNLLQGEKGQCNGRLGPAQSAIPYTRHALSTYQWEKDEKLQVQVIETS